MDWNLVQYFWGKRGWEERKAAQVSLQASAEKHKWNMFKYSTRNWVKFCDFKIKYTVPEIYKPLPPTTPSPPKNQRARDFRTLQAWTRGSDIMTHFPTIHLIFYLWPLLNNEKGTVAQSHATKGTPELIVHVTPSMNTKHWGWYPSRKD